ncbi:MAG: HD domain-containing protein [Candidatus Thorarchaeota archaeon]
MLEKETISIVRNYAFDNSEKDDIHGFPHVERVYNMCLQLGKELGANLFVLKIAALLHDIGRTGKEKTNNDFNHANISADMALNFLNSIDFMILENDIENVIHCIKAHSFSNNVVPRTLEAKILSDADKIDALGATGLYRTIGFTVKNQGSFEQVIVHLENKIMKLKDQLYLDASKQMATKRHQIILDFYNKILEERY